MYFGAHFAQKGKDIVDRKIFGGGKNFAPPPRICFKRSSMCTKLQPKVLFIKIRNYKAQKKEKNLRNGKYSLET